MCSGKQSWVWWLLPVIPATPEAEVGKSTLTEKQAKRAGVIIQVVKHLLNKHKGPKFNPKHCQKTEVKIPIWTEAQLTVMHQYPFILTNAW
jgi:hypothetical protein